MTNCENYTFGATEVFIVVDNRTGKQWETPRGKRFWSSTGAAKNALHVAGETRLYNFEPSELLSTELIEQKKTKNDRYSAPFSSQTRFKCLKASVSYSDFREV